MHSSRSRSTRTFALLSQGLQQAMKMVPARTRLRLLKLVLALAATTCFAVRDDLRKDLEHSIDSESPSFGKLGTITVKGSKIKTMISKFTTPAIEEKAEEDIYGNEIPADPHESKFRLNDAEGLTQHVMKITTRLWLDKYVAEHISHEYKSDNEEIIKPFIENITKNYQLKEFVLTCGNKYASGKYVRMDPDKRPLVQNLPGNWKQQFGNMAWYKQEVEDEIMGYHYIHRDVEDGNGGWRLSDSTSKHLYRTNNVCECPTRGKWELDVIDYGQEAPAPTFCLENLHNIDPKYVAEQTVIRKLKKQCLKPNLAYTFRVKLSIWLCAYILNTAAIELKRLFINREDLISDAETNLVTIPIQIGIDNEVIVWTANISIRKDADSNPLLEGHTTTTIFNKCVEILKATKWKLSSKKPDQPMHWEKCVGPLEHDRVFGGFHRFEESRKTTRSNMLTNEPEKAKKKKKIRTNAACVKFLLNQKAQHNEDLKNVYDPNDLRSAPGPISCNRLGKSASTGLLRNRKPGVEKPEVEKRKSCRRRRVLQRMLMNARFVSELP